MEHGISVGGAIELRRRRRSADSHALQRTLRNRRHAADDTDLCTTIGRCMVTIRLASRVAQGLKQIARLTTRSVSRSNLIPQGRTRRGVPSAVGVRECRTTPRRRHIQRRDIEGPSLR